MRLVESALSNDGPGSEITLSMFSSWGLLNKLGDRAEKAVDKGGETGKKDTRGRVRRLVERNMIGQRKLQKKAKRDKKNEVPLHIIS